MTFSSHVAQWHIWCSSGLLDIGASGLGPCWCLYGCWAIVRVGPWSPTPWALCAEQAHLGRQLLLGLQGEVLQHLFESWWRKMQVQGWCGGYSCILWSAQAAADTALPVRELLLFYWLRSPEAIAMIHPLGMNVADSICNQNMLWTHSYSMSPTRSRNPSWSNKMWADGGEASSGSALRSGLASSERGPDILFNLAASTPRICLCPHIADVLL